MLRVFRKEVCQIFGVSNVVPLKYANDRAWDGKNGIAFIGEVISGYYDMTKEEALVELAKQKQIHKSEDFELWINFQRVA